jgi:hypothetical protein
VAHESLTLRVRLDQELAEHRAIRSMKKVRPIAGTSLTQILGTRSPTAPTAKP